MFFSLFFFVILGENQVWNCFSRHIKIIKVQSFPGLHPCTLDSIGGTYSTLPHTYTHTHTHTHTHAHAHTRMHACARAHTHTHMHTPAALSPRFPRIFLSVAFFLPGTHLWKMATVNLSNYQLTLHNTLNAFLTFRFFMQCALSILTCFGLQEGDVIIVFNKV